jgi:hypothetical protein
MTNCSIKPSAATTATAPPKCALGIESDNVVNYCFPKTWPTDRDQRAAIIRAGCMAPDFVIESKENFRNAIAEILKWCEDDRILQFAPTKREPARR